MELGSQCSVTLIARFMAIRKPKEKCAQTARQIVDQKETMKNMPIVMVAEIASNCPNKNSKV
jgi:hypothetical protein